MKVISFFVSLGMVAVGTWARIQYRGIHDEIHGNQSIQFATLDECYGEGLTDPTCTGNDHDGRSTYQPKPAVSSGVQANPYLD